MSRLVLIFSISACFLLLGLPAFAQHPVFILPPQYPAGSAPVSIAIGDFNGDGKLDLAVMDFGGTVNILLGNGDGTFQPPVEYSVPGGGSVQVPGIVVADFNGDGKPDLAVANGQELSILLGNGDGTFQAAVSYGTDGGASSLAVGDFNGDGKPDLAVVGANAVSIFLNSGSGTFPTRTDFSTGYYPTSVVVGDFNGDGKLDLAVANLCGNVSSCNPAVANGSVSILLGNGNGTFQPHVEYTAGAGSVSIAVADLNGDGNLDLAVLNAPGDSGYPSAGSVSLLFGNGDGTFQSQVVYPTGLNPSSIVVDDFNGDGQLDFAVPNMGDSDVAVYLNQGHGSFAQPTAFSATFAGAAAAADFNGDGKADLAVLNIGNGNNGIVSVLLGRGDGSFSQTGIEYPALNPSFVAAADVNGDGKDDVVVVNNSDNNVSVFLGNGNATFQPPVNYTTGHGPQSVAIADLNGDGKPDLVVVNMTDNTVSVLLNNGSGTFAPHVDYPTAASPVFVAIGDVNGDGKSDLLVACLGEVSILLGNGDGTFQAATYIGPGGWSLALGDFNGDGFLDFAVAASNGVNVFLNNGHGGFGSQPLGSARLGGPKPDMIETTVLSVVAADFNGDGKLDLAVSDTTLFGRGTSIYLGNGDGTFQSPQSIGFGYGAYPVVADFNGDGILDMAFAGGLVLGNGNGTFSNAQILPAATGEGVVATGDFNGDGRSDLVVANSYGFFAGQFPGSGLLGSNTLSIFLNAGVLAPGFKITASPASQSVTAGNSVSYTITATAINGFNSSVALTCGDLPSGATCTFNPTSVTPTTTGANSTLTVNTATSTGAGTYSPVVTGTSGGIQRSTFPTLTVNPAPPDFSVSVPSSMTPNSVMPGQSATATVTLGSSGGFSGTVILACTVSPAMALGPTCSFSKQQVQLSSSGTPTSMLTVNTTGPTASVGRPASTRNVGLIYAMLLCFFGVIWLGLGSIGRDIRQKRLLVLMICSLVVSGTLFQAACGGGKGSTTSSGGTPAATYTVTISASSSSRHTASLKLKVQ